jgi:dienelactone hydrolase
MKAESLDTSYLARPDGAGPFPGVVVVHEASGLNDNIRDSFFNDRWRTYEPAAAADSWQRVLAFFADHVRDRPPGPA